MKIDESETQTAGLRHSPIIAAVWPGMAPGETTSSPGFVLEDRSGAVTRLTQVTGAQLFVYPLQTSEARPIVVVCPGGGYEILATDLEGAEIAAWLNSLGYVAAVLHYRVPQNRVGALQDGQRAISLLRTRAGEFGAALDCLGVLGFSAGGHLAVRLAVSGTDRAYIPRDALDDVSCRPDFALAIYPAYLMDKGTNLPVPEVSPQAAMPPLFLAQSRDDDHFCVSAYAQAAAEAGAHVQNRVYESGGHGYGARLDAGVPAARWQADAEEWLHEQCLQSAAAVAVDERAYHEN